MHGEEELYDMVEIRPLNGAYHLPDKQHPGDVGYDLHISEFTVIPGHQTMDVPCGFAMAMPDHMWARITGRSSTIRKFNLLVVEGIIDSGYRGPIFFAVHNLNPNDFIVHPGNRLAQMIFGYRVNPQFEITSELERSVRGERGFGSTGV